MGSFGLATAGWPDMLVSVHLEIESTAQPLTTSIVREALRLLRFEHPVIAYRLAHLQPPPGSPSPFGEPRLVYEIPASERDIDTWLSDIVVDRSDTLETVGGDMASAIATVRRQAAGAIPTYRPSQLDVHCIISSDGRNVGLVVRFGHIAFDGIGAFSFLDTIIRKFAEMITDYQTPRPPCSWGEEVARLAPSVVDNLRIPWIADGPKAETLVGKRVYESLERNAGKVRTHIVVLAFGYRWHHSRLYRFTPPVSE